MKLLETLLQIKIKDIVYLEQGKKIDVEKDAKSVRLDVYIEGENRVFDIEMQVTEKKRLGKNQKRRNLKDGFCIKRFRNSIADYLN